MHHFCSFPKKGIFCLWPRSGILKEAWDRGGWILTGVKWARAAGLMILAFCAIDVSCESIGKGK